MLRTSRIKPIEFRLHAPSAKRVNISGTFNNWSTNGLTAKRDSRGNWSVKVNLKPGRHEYKFLVDGSWLTDPNCVSCVPNTFGTQNCVVEVR